jgi:nicotinate-nucleotide adenylyltransferase
MVQLAVQKCPALTVSDIELVREGPSFTLDTVKEVCKTAEGALIWMALGGDAYSLISSWYRPEDVLAQVHLVVLTRPGYSVDLMTPLPKSLSERYTLSGDAYLHDSGGSLRTLQVSPLDISSSMIRKAVFEGDSIQDLVTADVLQYIQQKGLYRPQTV